MNRILDWIWEIPPLFGSDLGRTMLVLLVIVGVVYVVAKVRG